MDAATRNFYLGQQARTRKIAQQLDSPGLPNVDPGPGWDMFFQALHNKQQDAQDAGMNFRADPNGLGQPAGATPAWASPDYVAARNIASSQALDQMHTDAVAQQADRAQASVIGSQAAGSLTQEAVDRDAMQRASQPGLTRDQSLAAASPSALASQMLRQQFAQQDAQRAAVAAAQAKVGLENAQAAAATSKSGLENAQATAATKPGVGEGLDTPDAKSAIDQAASVLAATGRMPPNVRVYGKDSGAFYMAVLAKSKALTDASGVSLGSAAANYGANEASQRKIQATSDAAQAFLATADKNANLLAGAMQGLPDTGNPMFNRPLRAFAAGVQGDPKMSQFATYLTSVQNEYGKILSNPNLSGQLTDSARREAQALVDPRATIPQILASIAALRSEGANRLQSLQGQIATVQGRIAGPAAAPADGGMVRLQAPDGSVQAVPAGQVAHYLSLGAKRIQ